MTQKPQSRGQLLPQEFIARGRAGEAVVYATPEGNFYSPEMFKRALEEAVAAAREEAVRGRSCICEIHTDECYDKRKLNQP